MEEVFVKCETVETHAPKGRDHSEGQEDRGRELGLSGREGGVAARSALGVVGAFFPLSFRHSLWAPKDVQAVGAATRTLRLGASFLRCSPPLALLRAASRCRLPPRGLVDIVVPSQPPTTYTQLTGLCFPSTRARPEPRRRQPPTNRESPRWPRGEGGVWARVAAAPERGEAGSRPRAVADHRVGEACLPRATPDLMRTARVAQYMRPGCGRSGPA